MGNADGLHFGVWEGVAPNFLAFAADSGFHTFVGFSVLCARQRNLGRMRKVITTGFPNAPHFPPRIKVQATSAAKPEGFEALPFCACTVSLPPSPHTFSSQCVASRGWGVAVNRAWGRCTPTTAA